MPPSEYDRAAVVAPSDTIPLPHTDAGFPYARALYVGAAGALKVKTAGGDTLTLPAVSAGHLFLSVVQVFATGTTASNIIALY